jgi:tetratricopeptide (TPR) repeat protein
VALALVFILARGWLRERRASEATRLTTNGIGLLGIGREREARKSLRSSLDVDPGNAPALGNLAVVDLKLGDDEAALEHAQAAVRAAPGEAVHHFNLGVLLALKRRYEEAIVSLRRAIEIDPGYANAYNELGNVYLDLDRPAEARKAFEAGLKRDQSLAKLHKNLGRAALAEGHPEEAVRHLKTALPLYSPTDPAGKAEAAYWLAVAQASLGRVSGVCPALRTFAALDPHRLSEVAKDAAALAKKRGCVSWP